MGCCGFKWECGGALLLGMVRFLLGGGVGRGFRGDGHY